MSELPSGWAQVPLHEFASTTSGGTPRRSRLDLYGGPIPWVKSGELNDGFVEACEETITQAGLENSSAKIFPAGTLCIALYGATVGKLGILGMSAATNQAVCGISPASDIETKFLFYYLLSQRMNLINQSQGGAQPNISQGIVRSTEVPICARPEQGRIVAEIEKQFTRLDAATAALKRVQANLKRYRASVLKAACEGRLVPTEAELARKERRDYEPASELLKRILRERRARWEADTLAKMIASGKRPTDDRWKHKYKEPLSPDTSALSELPEGWVWTSIDQLICEPLRNGHSAKAASDGIGIRTLTLSAVTYGDFSERNTKITIADSRRVRDLWLRPGDLLVERSNTPELVGTARLYRGAKDYAIFPDLLIRIRLINGVYGLYIEAWLQTEQMKRYFRDSAQGISGTMPKIDQETIEQGVVPLPPEAEQRRIADAMTVAHSSFDRLETEMLTDMLRSERLRRAILADAFSGKLVPQNPTDEPASVLLERIRAERVQSLKGAARRNGRRPHAAALQSK